MICAGANAGFRRLTVAALLAAALPACVTAQPAPVVFKAGPLSVPMPSAVAPGRTAAPPPVVATPPSAFVTAAGRQTPATRTAPPSSRAVTATPLPAIATPPAATASLPPAPRARPTARDTARIGPGTHRVRPGETIYAVSRKSQVTLRDLIEANGLTAPYRLQAGQRLIIPQARYHRVRAGETLYAIARRYDVDMPSIVRANGLTAPYTVAAGQRLRLPEGLNEASTPRNATAPVRTAAAETTQAPPPATTVAVEAAPQPATRPSAAVRTIAVPRGAIPKPPPRSGRGFAWPVDGRVISRFGGKPGGMRNDGINIATRRGAAVRAADDGVVAYAGNELKGFGNMLLLRHADGWMTAYAHNEKVLVKLGDRVRRGQVVARAGSSGNVTSPQLHFEIRKGTVAVDPARHLEARSADGGERRARAGLSGGRPDPG